MSDETTAASAARRATIDGMHGRTANKGIPGQRKRGSIAQEETSQPRTGNDEGEPQKGFWTVKPSKYREWRVGKPEGFSQPVDQKEMLRQQLAAAKRTQRRLAQQRLNRYRQQLEMLDLKKLEEKVTASYVKIMFYSPPSPQIQNEFLLASAELSGRQVLLKAISDAVAKETAEIERLDTEVKSIEEGM